LLASYIGIQLRSSAKKKKRNLVETLYLGFVVDIFFAFTNNGTQTLYPAGREQKWLLVENGNHFFCSFFGNKTTKYLKHCGE